MEKIGGRDGGSTGWASFVSRRAIGTDAGWGYIVEYLKLAGGSSTSTCDRGLLGARRAAWSSCADGAGPEHSSTGGALSLGYGLSRCSRAT